jgi:type II secretion system protein C
MMDVPRAVLRRQHDKSKRAALLALITGVGFGAVLGPQMWPHLDDWINEQSALPSPIQAGVPASGPLVPPPVSASSSRDEDFTGTRSSLSAEPLPLVLTGTVVGSRAGESVAFIGADEGSPQTYAMGAILANGARLAKIDRDYVVLERDGASVRLYAQNVRGHSRASSELMMVGAPKAFTPARSNNTDRFTEFLRPNPVYEGDAFVGIEVYAGSRAALFSRLGFQGGDIITAIDDAPMNDPQAATEALHQLASGIGGVVTVKRKGRTERFAIDGMLVTEELQDAASANAIAATTPHRPAS